MELEWGGGSGEVSVIFILEYVLPYMEPGTK
jgi:hypothetical protein